MATNLQRVDQNLQVIRQIEGAWSLPKLPEQVALDLAGNNIMEPAALQGLLTGLDEDLQEAQRREPFPTRDTVGAMDVVPAKPQLEIPAGQVTVGTVIAGVTGLDAPTVLDPMATQRLKQRLVNEGYLNLTEAEVASPRWLPEYSYAAAQHSFDQLSKQFQGEKPGSISVEQIFGLVDEWLSPRGLYRAAVELDLWWDFEQIGEEFDSWGAKLKAWREDPWNLRKLIDVATGPLDDILFPILNIGLMFTGIGEIFGVGRALFTGVKGARAVAGLHRGAKGLRFLDEVEMAADIARLQQPSFLSAKVANMGRAGAALSGRMDAWRQLSGVTLAKKVNQQAIKLGFTSKLEQLIDADRGGQSVSHLFTEDRLAEQVYETFSNPLLDWGVDLLLYPTNIFTPGRFAKPAKAFVEQTRKGFLKAANNQELTMAWYEPVLRHLEETEGAEAAKAFREDVKKKKLKGALRDHLFGGDEETMGAAMSYVTVMAAIDHAARHDASILAGAVLNELDSKTRTLYHQSRNMLRGRLRYLDPDDVEGMLEHFAKYGLPGDEPNQFMTRSAREFWANRDNIAAAYMETAEEAAARGGAVPEGHIRFYGHMDTDTGEIVWRTSAPTAIPVSEALRRWDELPDDTLIEVYHSTTPELAERMLREGVKKGAKKKADYSTWLTGEGFYVGDDPDRLRFLFGRQGPETPGTPLGILVRKGDLADSPEALRMGLDMREALRDPLVGAQILDDIPAERIRIIEDPANVTAPIAGDPYFVDIAESELRSVLGDQADAVLRGEGNLPPSLTRRYRMRSELSNSRYPRLSEAASVRAFKPEKIEKLKELARRHNSLREAELARILADVDPKMVSQYIYETLPTFGNWVPFLQATSEIRHALMRGDLDAARYVVPRSFTNRRLSSMPETPSGRKWGEDLMGIMSQFPDDERTLNLLMRSTYSPFARDVDPVFGSFTVASFDTPLKQDALAFAGAVEWNIKNLEAVRKAQRDPRIGDAFRRVREIAETEGLPSKDVVREILAETVGSVNENTATLLRRVVGLLDEGGSTLADVEAVLMRRLAQLDASADWSEVFRVPTNFGADARDIVEKLRKKVRELRRQANFMASEVENVPEELVQFLADRGYRLVHGVDFHQPFDMEDIFPVFADASARQIKQMRLGAFFDRQDPQYVSKLKVRKVRDALHAQLSRVDSEGGVALNLGPKPDPGNADLDAVMADLWEILHAVWERAGLFLDDVEDSRIAEKFWGRAATARIPWSLDRLGSDLGFKKFVSLVMARGYSRKQAIAMYRALQSAQNLGFRTYGLYAIETKLRSEPNLIEGLRALGTIQASDRFRGIRPIRATAGFVAGGYAGSMASQEMGVEPGSAKDIALRASGAVLGGALGGSPKVGIPGVAKLVSNLENSNFVRYAYVADWLANMRDYVRFAMSPIFDASRYSEAIILSQIGHMPEGVRNLRINQSPKAFRRMLAKEFRAQGLDPETALRRAKSEWEKYQSMFAAQAHGYRDFDWEAIDGIGRRFSTVGILGFSPTDWMASTFAHMVRAGADPKKAYDAVREIYTYGTTGRSAAELSMNFVFFPFSFTKKTVGHLQKFFSDDLTRLVVLHDMVATYQMLDEHYNLSQEWKDRLPILERAHRLNLLAYGIGLGRFGGINAPIIEAIGRLAPDEVMDMVPGAPEVVNMFIPQMVPLSTADDANNLWDLTRQLIPVMNDVQTMVDAIAEQGRVIVSETHLTRRAEVRRAWEEWRDFQDRVKQGLDAMGMSWAQAIRNPQLAAMIQAEKTRISLKYPAWKLEMGDGIADNQAIQMELQERIARPMSNADLLLAEFVTVHETVTGMLREGGLVWSRPEDMPPEIFAAYRQVAIHYARQDPEFVRLYNRFFRRLFGDIVSEV